MAVLADATAFHLFQPHGNLTAAQSFRLLVCQLVADYNHSRFSMADAFDLHGEGAEKYTKKPKAQNYRLEMFNCNEKTS